jgi:hypothetical protein
MLPRSFQGDACAGQSYLQSAGEASCGILICGESWASQPAWSGRSGLLIGIEPQKTILWFLELI